MYFVLPRLVRRLIVRPRDLIRDGGFLLLIQQVIEGAGTGVAPPTTSYATRCASNSSPRKPILP
jgi:hypothetical protein